MRGEKKKPIQHRLVDQVNHKAVPPQKGQRPAAGTQQRRTVSPANQNPPQQAAAKEQENPGQQRVIIAGNKVMGRESQNRGEKITVKKGGKICLPKKPADFAQADRIGGSEQQKTADGSGQRREPVQQRAKKRIQQHGAAQKMEHAEPVGHGGNQEKSDGGDG